MAQQFFFYPHILDNLPIPESGFDVCQDMGDKRLRIYITARGIKTFFIRKRVHGKDIRIILGNYPKISIDEARLAIGMTLQKLAQPAKMQNRRILFSRAVKIFIAEKIRRAPQSMQKLNRTVQNLWRPLLDRHISDITSHELIELNKSIAKDHGAATANRMREIMRSLFAYSVMNNWIRENPALELSPMPEHRRKNRLTMAQLKKILGRIKHEKNGVLRNAFLMLVFGFMRKSAVFSMDWNDLDMKTYYYNNHPLTDNAAVLLQNMPQTGKWVFPNGRGGHISDPRVSWNKIADAAGLAGVQMNDCTKLLHSQLKWSNHPETLRENMNAVLDKLS